ncbi:ferroxidase fet3 [Coemansia linderi]|uniref:Ferroxidase fet3 n=1 Tax=Coemansia linderi TaxID=2663919 RepID=A0ACC1KDA0_9FUNG|nr:ferroxidase fet3 [Coemansia linderi]
MLFFRQAASVVLLFGSLTSAARVLVDWDIGYVNLDRDGHSPRRAIGVNGALPIPPVFATKGDTLVIKVRNSLDVSTSIHAHGLFQNGTSYMDGPAMVTQCGIPPGHSFTYEYEADHAGTFWLHGHDHHQNSDGLRTPLIVRERREPHRYDDEYLLSLEDWYQFEFADRLKDTLDPTKSFPPPPSFPYALFNGYPTTPTLKFKPGKTYRIRIVNMSTTEWFQFNLPGHQMRVIEADGEHSRPSAVDGLDMGPGERYSVLVTAHPTDSHNYHYNATLYAGFVPKIEDKNPRYYQGLIEYREGAPTMPTTEPRNFKWVNDVELCALSGNPPLPVDRQIELTIGGSLFTTGQILDVINNITYAQPKIPTLHSALSLSSPLHMNESLYGPQTHAIVLRHLESVELTVNSPNNLPHPMHLHGHAFQIIEYGSLANRSEPVRRFSPECNAPMQRDTIVVPVNSYVKLRFRADNPGVWLFHCHMDIHFGMGMALTFVEAPDVLRQRQQVPDSMLELCRAQGVRTEGNGAGNAGFDLTGLPAPPVRVLRGGPALPPTE